MIQLKIFNLSNQLMNIEMLVQFNKNKNQRFSIKLKCHSLLIKILLK
jgi:hypothetical protein